jgi:hypothetical protein
LEIAARVPKLAARYKAVLLVAAVEYNDKAIAVAVAALGWWSVHLLYPPDKRRRLAAGGQENSAVEAPGRRNQESRRKETGYAGRMNEMLFVLDDNSSAAAAVVVALDDRKMDRIRCCIGVGGWARSPSGVESCRLLVETATESVAAADDIADTRKDMVDKTAVADGAWYRYDVQEGIAKNELLLRLLWRDEVAGGWPTNPRMKVLLWDRTDLNNGS